MGQESRKEDALRGLDEGVGNPVCVCVSKNRLVAMVVTGLA